MRRNKKFRFPTNYLIDFLNSVFYVFAPKLNLWIIYLGEVFGFYLNKNIINSAPIKLNPNSNSINVNVWNLILSGDADSLTKPVGITNPTPVPIILITDNIAVATGLYS